MAGGRFRVKSGIDRETAERLFADLEAMGARCTLEDETGRPVPRSQAAGAAGNFQSGLAAAANAREQDLGVLGASASGLALATLDGEDDRPAPGQEAVPSFDPSAFAPPPSEASEDHLQLAIDPKRSRRSASAPVFTVDEDDPELAELMASQGAPSSGSTREGPARAATSPAPLGAVAATTGDSALPAMAPRMDSQAGGRGASTAGRPLASARDLVGRARDELAWRPRVRFAAGVTLAVLLGFFAGHLFASFREGSVYDRIDAQVDAAQASVTTVEEWEALDRTRQSFLDKKRAARRNIALGSIFVWILVGAGSSYLWFRRIDWDVPGQARPR